MLKSQFCSFICSLSLYKKSQTKYNNCLVYLCKLLARFLKMLLGEVNFHSNWKLREWGEERIERNKRNSKRWSPSLPNNKLFQGQTPNNIFVCKFNNIQRAFNSFSFICCYWHVLHNLQRKKYTRSLFRERLASSTTSNAGFYKVKSCWAWERQRDAKSKKKFIPTKLFCIKNLLIIYFTFST